MCEQNTTMKNPKMAIVYLLIFDRFSFCPFSLFLEHRISYFLFSMHFWRDAEIEAREKQYEFYRDLLLTFARTGAIISDRQTDKQ